MRKAATEDNLRIMNEKGADKRRKMKRDKISKLQ